MQTDTHTRTHAHTHTHKRARAYVRQAAEARDAANWTLERCTPSVEFPCLHAEFGTSNNGRNTNPKASLMIHAV